VNAKQIVSEQVAREKEFKASKLMFGFLTEKQFHVLELRSRGYTQRDISQLFHTSRAAISMIEGRAKKQIEKAKETVKIYETFSRNQHKVTIEIGTRLQKIPVLVLQEADRFQIHIQYNMIEISRLVRKHMPDCLNNGLTVKEITISFNEKGNISIL